MKFFILSILLTISLSAFSQNEYYFQLNMIREQNGLAPLVVDHKLERKSSKWLKHISRYPGLPHDKNVNEVMCENTYNPVDSWLKSRAHKKLIMSPKFTKIGMAWLGNRYCARLE